VKPALPSRRPPVVRNEKCPSNSSVVRTADSRKVLSDKLSFRRQGRDAEGEDQTEAIILDLLFIEGSLVDARCNGAARNSVCDRVEATRAAVSHRFALSAPWKAARDAGNFRNTSVRPGLSEQQRNDAAWPFREIRSRGVRTRVAGRTRADSVVKSLNVLLRVVRHRRRI